MILVAVRVGSGRFAGFCKLWLTSLANEINKISGHPQKLLKKLNTYILYTDDTTSSSIPSIPYRNPLYLLLKSIRFTAALFRMTINVGINGFGRIGRIVSDPPNKNNDHATPFLSLLRR